MKNEWSELLKAVSDAGHDYHLFALSTTDGNKPDLRTVVLRKVDNDKNQISFYTDTRSPKYHQILKTPPSAPDQFYDSKRRIKIRVKSLVSPNDDKILLKTLWNKLNKDKRQCYQGDLTPSDPLPNYIIINQIMYQQLFGLF